MLYQSLKEVLRTTKSHFDALNDMGLNSVRDLLLYFPWRYDDESEFSTISELSIVDSKTVRGKLSKIYVRKTNTGKTMIRAVFSDSTGSCDVMWFNQNYLRQLLKEDMTIILSGKIKWNGRRATLISPRHEIPKHGVDLIHTGRVVPVYHESGKISSKWLREKIRPILYLAKFFQDPLPIELIEKYNLMPLSEAVIQIHFPDSDELLSRARYRLGFEELFFIQLKSIYKKKVWQEKAAQNSKFVDIPLDWIDEFRSNLPFQLTNAQQSAIDEILGDLSSKTAMSRLLEGDVGSGKTIVAALAMFIMIKSGYQAVLMVPTEILAKQHYKTMYKIFKDFGFNVQLLTGSLTKGQKDQLVNSMKSGAVDLVVGTHAIIQEKVGFLNLGISVIDEQHRFGVNQRAVLRSFGTPHVLSMTATPIPRTLALTIYGDQDLSIIDELPPGRQPIITRTVPEKKRADAYEWIKSEIGKGRQAFVVCPLIDESETLEVKSAIQEYERLSTEVFDGLRLGLLHGKLKQVDKDEIMLRFVNHELDILVSTTVIEVGIDVPNASIMLIEAADRFGLAQLHQLRGRVGRGAHQSYCFLFPESNSELSRKRMKAMVDFQDGFKLAEIDLELRGPGEVYGVRQSGIPDLKMASLSDHELVKLARDAAIQIIDIDNQLNNYPLLLEKIMDEDINSDYSL